MSSVNVEKIIQLLREVSRPVMSPSAGSSVIIRSSNTSARPAQPAETNVQSTVSTSPKSVLISPTVPLSRYVQCTQLLLTPNCVNHFSQVLIAFSSSYSLTASGPTEHRSLLESRLVVFLTRWFVWMDVGQNNCDPLSIRVSSHGVGNFTSPSKW